uniref:NADH-ubiquinone oxidoreductase chain 6 n=1 Tax=Hypothenemus sp. BMNH 1040235 TaxID=1903787 RepID=A0A343A625_9CUCU|nr:NADH dehydrogenase subunit 6 [Hypothenemus sp. BMNH 1040235]
MLMMIMSYISITLMFLKHPLSMGMALILQALLTALTSGLIYKNFWFSYVLFLVMIGGVMVMFIYMTSIASNEKFKMPSPEKLIFTGTIMMIIMFKNNKEMLPSKDLEMSLSLSKFFNFPKMQMTILLMIYLFVALIAVVKISNKTMGPLRQN